MSPTFRCAVGQLSRELEARWMRTGGEKPGGYFG
jgi:hypothetical protein